MGTVHGKRLLVCSQVQCENNLGIPRTTLSGNALEKILRYGLIFALEWFDENNSVIRLGFLCVEALNAKRHGAYFLIASRLLQMWCPELNAR